MSVFILAVRGRTKPFHSFRGARENYISRLVCLTLIQHVDVTQIMN